MVMTNFGSTSVFFFINSSEKGLEPRLINYHYINRQLTAREHDIRILVYHGIMGRECVSRVVCLQSTDENRSTCIQRHTVATISLIIDIILWDRYRIRIDQDIRIETPSGPELQIEVLGIQYFILRKNNLHWSPESLKDSQFMYNYTYTIPNSYAGMYSVLATTLIFDLHRLTLLKYRWICVQNPGRMLVAYKITATREHPFSSTFRAHLLHGYNRVFIFSAYQLRSNFQSNFQHMHTHGNMRFNRPLRELNAILLCIVHK